MDNLQYKAQIGLILAGLYLALLVLERLFPLRKPKRDFLPRAVINVCFTVAVYLTAVIIISPAVSWGLGFTADRHFGITPFISHNPVLGFILGFLLLDLSFYYWHRLNHQWPLLWRFHNVHHCDPDLDVTTSMRFHFIEIAYSGIFRVIQVIIIAPNLITFLAYEFAFQANTFFHHSNLKLPLWLERGLNKVLVTPRMHGIHHSDYQNETNSNYSVVLSVWDRVHRSLKLNIRQENICIGVAAYEKPKDNKLLNLISLPFKAQRHYWQKDKKNHLARSEVKEISKSSMQE